MSVRRDWLQSRRLATMSQRGEMAERTKATVSKTVESHWGSVGSNPTLSATLFPPHSGEGGLPLSVPPLAGGSCRRRRRGQGGFRRDGRADEGDGLENR